MKRTIATIGYEGSTIDAFIAALQSASIDLLIDVRDLPLSRKRGFSKRQLAEALAASGIEYIHLRGLGDPKPGREAARAGEYEKFRAIFDRHMKSQAAVRDVSIAAEMVRKRRACLMCFECDHKHCHRSIVADLLSEITELTITPLNVHDADVTRVAA